jgi:hypothetical protein
MDTVSKFNSKGCFGQLFKTYTIQQVKNGWKRKSYEATKKGFLSTEIASAIL